LENLSFLQSDVQNLVTSESIILFLFNIVLAAILSHVVGLIYVRYGGTLSNRRAFAKNFILVSLTTLLVITVVKSSLALSLGLIGALSIVRFRAAIKEPEELSYIFLVISIGLGMGAGQQAITIVAVIAILIILRLKEFLSKDAREAKTWDPDLYLTISANKDGGLKLDDITKIIEENCSRLRLKRADVSSSQIEALFVIELAQAHGPHLVEAALRKIDQSISVTFLEAE